MRRNLKDQMKEMKRKEMQNDMDHEENLSYGEDRCVGMLLFQQVNNSSIKSRRGGVEIRESHFPKLKNSCSVQFEIAPKCEHNSKDEEVCHCISSQNSKFNYKEIILLKVLFSDGARY